MSFSYQLAYCTNIHPGTDLATVRSNLAEHALRVRASLIASGDYNQDEPLGVGLWLSNAAAMELLETGGSERFAAWLEENHLLPFTFNGFPQNNFHQPVVKHRVYEPTWWDEERFAYTRRLIQVMDELLPAGVAGSISTLPIAWSKPAPTEEQLRIAAFQLKRIAVELDRVLQSSQREIVLAIEPEPGCAVTDGSSMRRFFQDYLLEGPDRSIVARHLGVCHDICHAAVMRENQGLELAAYRQSAIRVGKIQVSSAIHVDWDSLTQQERCETLTHLSKFAEDRYLHQTTVVSASNPSLVLHEDLPALIRSVVDPTSLAGTWRVHFHVPIFLERAGLLGTTQGDIGECLRSLPVPHRHRAELPGNSAFTGHLEVETYAWGVLPAEHRGPSLAEDIASELRYLRAFLTNSLFP